MILLTTLRRAAVVALLAQGVACAPRAADTTAEPTAEVTAGTRTGRRAADSISREELDGGQWTNAYEMISALRPRWLSSRGPDTILGENVEVQVMLDDLRLGGPATLRGLRVGDIASVRFISPTDAAARWGADYHNGVIYVVTRR